eukprot:105286-Chlamydomonas_euryale.AAC.1
MVCAGLKPSTPVEPFPQWPPLVLVVLLHEAGSMQETEQRIRAAATCKHALPGAQAITYELSSMTHRSCACPRQCERARRLLAVPTTCTTCTSTANSPDRRASKGARPMHPAVHLSMHGMNGACQHATQNA